MALVFFDLDHTLIQGDSDYLWGEFLVSQGLIDKEEYQEKNLQFYEDYQQGKLDTDQYLRFSLAPLSKYHTDELLSCNHDFIETIIRPLIYEESHSLIQKHQENNDRLIIHSSTNSFIVSPIARLLGIKEIICTQLEIIGEQYTGKYIGLPNYGQNKVKNTHQWLVDNQLSTSDLRGCFVYSDSFNDLPLLQMATHAIAVNADEKLRKHALNCDWRIIDFKKQAI